ncbi:MAG: DUF1588 domain-containing protein [Hyphomicrobiaceae bacterium]
MKAASAARGVSLAVLLAASGAMARVAPSSGEQQALAADPILYTASRVYFPTDDPALPARRLFRLTRDQIDLTVAALLPGYVKRSVKEVMPKDPLQTNYEYAEMIGLNAANWGPLSTWIAEIAARVRSDPKRLVACPDTRDEACLKEKARGFVVRAFRGAAPPAKVDRLVGFFLEGVRSSGAAQAVGDLVEVVLNSPDFLFRKEVDVDAAGHLAPAERLETLAYTLADAPPWKLGLAVPVKEGDVADPDATAAVAERILAAPEARAKLVRFFKTWLEIKAPADFTISRETFPEFTPQLAEAMVAETDRFLEAKLAQPAPRLKDITRASEAFVSKPLEALYAAKAADPSGRKAVPVDATRRLGIFSQPAVIASHSGPTGTRLVKRGVFWVRKVMCMEMSPPPPGINTTLYGGAKTTERARIEEVTAKKACIGCHKKIDPFGFLQENWDALGRWRALDNGFPVDAAISIDFLDEQPVETSGPVEALRVLTGAMMFKQCFVRQLFRFYMGRNEEPGDDPLLRRMFLAFAARDEQDILQALRVLAVAPRTVLRK